MERGDGVRQQAPAGRDRMPGARVAGSDDRAVPIHHAEMLHISVPGSEQI
jgi:hypothetical protein